MIAHNTARATKHSLSRLTRWICAALFAIAPLPAGAAESGPGWRAGVARSVITPKEFMWMGGFAARTKPAEGKLDELHATALALEASDGGKALLVTLDLVGVPKWLYENLCAAIKARHGLPREAIRFAASHTHSGPVLRDALQDIYPLDDRQRELIVEYSKWIEPAILETVDRAIADLKPATLAAGEGNVDFGINRRTNVESEAVQMLLQGQKPNGPSDHAVPVLAIRDPGGAPRAVVFGYAAHTSALTDNYLWSADYCGEAVRLLEQAHPGATAMFFQGCGSDQSALPRGTVERCRKLGADLAAAVDRALAENMRPLAPRFRAAFEFVNLDFGARPDQAHLERVGAGTDYQARWARRLLAESGAGKELARGYPEYPVQAWKLGADQLWIGLGGEVCVDYALRLKRDLAPGAWVNGYANDVMAYIPSRRLWEEGGYQAGAFEVYGLPATRWRSDIEERIVGAAARLSEKVR